MISEACKYSFDDLHHARFGRVMTEAQKQKLYALSQDKRNEVVQNWANVAGWRTEDILGEDCVTYRSFWPTK